MADAKEKRKDMTIQFRVKYKGNLLDLTLDEKDFPKLFDFTPLLDRIGLMLVSQIQRGFDNGGPLGDWPETMQPDIPAIAQRISDGKGVPDRYIGGKKKPGIDTGHLRQSIAHQVLGGVLFVGTNVSYARTFQEGGPSTVKNKIPDLIANGDKRAQRALKKVEKKFPKAANLLKRKKEITVNVRKRPFLVLTDKMKSLVIALVKDWLMEMR